MRQKCTDAQIQRCFQSKSSNISGSLLPLLAHTLPAAPREMDRWTGQDYLRSPERTGGGTGHLLTPLTPQRCFPSSSNLSIFHTSSLCLGWGGEQGEATGSNGCSDRLLLLPTSVCGSVTSHLHPALISLQPLPPPASPSLWKRSPLPPLHPCSSCCHGNS